MFPERIAARLEPLVGPIESVTPVGGGCISNAGRVKAAKGTFFLKWAVGDGGQTFEAEAAGLTALRDAAIGMVVPEPLEASNAPAGSAEPGFILLEWIEEGPRGGSYWTRLGGELANIHRRSGPAFGFERDNFVGRLPQANTWANSWVEFFRDRRLRFQRRLARNRGGWQSGWDPHFDRLLVQLGDILPSNPEPSTVHGDLWGGNALARSDGAPVIIDPAAHFGHREVDLAMTELFGGFGKGFYHAYQEAWRLEPGYEQRRDIYNLYHLINHVNHFGRSYAGQVESILGRY